MKANWPTARVGDILKIRNGYAVKSSDYSREGIPLIRQSDINGTTIDISAAKRVPARVMEECGQYLVRKGDLLIGMSGSLGKIGRYVEEEVAIQNQRTGLLQVKPGFTAGFAKLVLQLVEQQIIAEGKGVAVQNVSAKEIEDCTFPLPPEGERERVVEEIENQFTRLDAGVASLKQVQSALKRYRASVLKTACEGDWPEQPLGQIAEVKLGKMLDKVKHVSGRKLPYLRNVNVRWGAIDTDDLLEMCFDEDELGRYGLQPFDVLVCEGGEPGRAAVWTGGIPNLKYQKALHRVRFKIEYNPKLLVWRLESLARNGGLERRFTGTTIKHFTREAFVQLPIPIPPPPAQKKIVQDVEARLSIIEEIETVVNTNVKRATRLRQSILRQAFSRRLARRLRTGNL
jgi:type I restriction enzyme S subunit